jgi:signal transduction histidine kinase
MLAAIAESSIVAWPLAITMATVVVADRTRTRRRRERLNRAIHELRRPLQALTLSWPPSANPARDHLGLALEALGELDRRVNDAQAPVRRAVELVDARELADDAVRRWRPEAAAHGREIGLRWRANGSRLVCDRGAVARALDNLIANSLEHGSGPIRVEGSVRGGRLRMSVADGPDPGLAPSAAPARTRGARRGHGLRIVAEIAADHGGRFAACAHRGGARAVLELPLAGVASAASR